MRRVRVTLVDAKVLPDAYNPYGGKCVQLAWQRYSNSPWRPSARPSGRRAAPSGPVRPARPAACR